MLIRENDQDKSKFPGQIPEQIASVCINVYLIKVTLVNITYLIVICFTLCMSIKLFPLFLSK